MFVGTGYMGRSPDYLFLFASYILSFQTGGTHLYEYLVGLILLTYLIMDLSEWIAGSQLGILSKGMLFQKSG